MLIIKVIREHGVGVVVVVIVVVVVVIVVNSGKRSTEHSTALHCTLVLSPT